MSKPGGGLGGGRGEAGGGGFGMVRVSRHDILGRCTSGGSAIPEKPNALSHDASLYMPKHFFSASMDRTNFVDEPSPPSVTRAPYTSSSTVMADSPKSRVTMVCSTLRHTKGRAR